MFCLNDDMVWAALQAAGKLSLLVPEDLEIAGFFDSAAPAAVSLSCQLSPESRNVTAEITTYAITCRRAKEADG